MKLEAKQRLQAAKPKEPTAVLLRNFLVKQYGAEVVKSLGIPKVSAPTQSLMVTLDPKKIPKVIADFKAHGWKQGTHVRFPFVVLEYPNDPVIQIIIDPQSDWRNVQCIGRQGFTPSSTPIGLT